MEELMQLVFEVKDKLSDSEYKTISEKIASVYPHKDVTIEYPQDTNGNTSVVVAPMRDHVANLKRRIQFITRAYVKDTKRYLKHILDLSEENLKLRRQWEEENDDEDEDDEDSSSYGA